MEAEFNFKMNLEAINRFMKGEKVEKSFGDL